MHTPVCMHTTWAPSCFPLRLGPRSNSLRTWLILIHLCISASLHPSSGLCVYPCIRMCTLVSVYPCICAPMYLWYLCVYVSMCLCVCLCVYVSVCLSVCLCGMAYGIWHRYEGGWRAVMAYTDGVILVYNPGRMTLKPTLSTL
jgi:hypothetical protein